MPEILKLETSAESSYVKWVDKQGYIAIKINKRGWPDRITILDYGYSFYIEFKRENKKDKFGKRVGEKLQKYRHNELRKKGVHVYLVDNIYDAKDIFKYELEFSKKLKLVCNSFKEYRS